MSEITPTEDNQERGEMPATVPKELEQVLNLVPVESRAKAAKLMVTISKSMSYKGSIPHPDIINGYEQILPGSARELLDMTKEQSTHRMYLEKTVINSQNSQSKIGQIFAFIIALICIIFSFILGMMNHTEVAITLGGGTVLGLVSTFIYGKYKQKESLQEKSSTPTTPNNKPNN